MHGRTRIKNADIDQRGLIQIKFHRGDVQPMRLRAYVLPDVAFTRDQVRSDTLVVCFRRRGGDDSSIKGPTRTAKGRMLYGVAFSFVAEEWKRGCVSACQRDTRRETLHRSLAVTCGIVYCDNKQIIHKQTTAANNTRLDAVVVKVRTGVWREQSDQPREIQRCFQ